MTTKNKKLDPLSTMERRDVIEQIIALLDKLNWSAGVPLDEKAGGMIIGREKFVIDFIQGDYSGDFAFYTPPEREEDRPAIKVKPSKNTNEDLN